MTCFKVNVPLSAKMHVKEADVALILGTSLSVQPFAKMAQTPRQLAIVNIERVRPFEAEERAKVMFPSALYKPIELIDVIIFSEKRSSIVERL